MVLQGPKKNGRRHPGDVGVSPRGSQVIRCSPGAPTPMVAGFLFTDCHHSPPQGLFCCARELSPTCVHRCRGARTGGDGNERSRAARGAGQHMRLHAVPVGAMALRMCPYFALLRVNLLVFSRRSFCALESKNGNIMPFLDSHFSFSFPPTTAAMSRRRRAHYEIMRFGLGRGRPFRNARV